MVIVAAVVGLVESATLENDAGPAAQQPPNLATAFRTALQRLVLHALEFFKLVAALLAGILIRRHNHTNLSR